MRVMARPGELSIVIAGVLPFAVHLLTLSPFGRMDVTGLPRVVDIALATAAGSDTALTEQIPVEPVFEISTTTV